MKCKLFIHFIQFYLTENVIEISFIKLWERSCPRCQLNVTDEGSGPGIDALDDVGLFGQKLCQVVQLLKLVDVVLSKIKTSNKTMRHQNLLTCTLTKILVDFSNSILGKIFYLHPKLPSMGEHKSC